MRSRSKTMAQNAAVFLGVAAVIAGDAWFAGSYVQTQQGQEQELKDEIQSLASEFERKSTELKRADERADEFVKAIAGRREELDGYGEFLPPDSNRPEVQKFLLQTIEDLHIKILKTEEVRLTKKTHYSILDIALTLRGSYRDFKLLLARIYKSESFIRVKKFDLLTLEDEKHEQEVEIQFQTYFSTARG